MPYYRTIPRVCVRCGTEFLAYRGEVHRGGALFCTRHCAGEARRGRTATSLGEKLWGRVTRSDAATSCWIRLGSALPRGYTTIRHCGRNIYGHRAAWEEASGENIRRGLMVLHTCDTPRCVRNDDRGTYKVGDRLLPRWGHLFLGTHADNMADMRAKGRGATGEQNGAHTHPEAFLRGAASPTAKLTDAAVRAILKGRAQGVPLQVLADQYGVSDSTISRVALRQTYRERR